ncbi:helix-turn-helix domain-containing protein [Pusillimonas sp. SM2304]|uniref:IclR family transcriptional regulator n=1 Tax=Pusillimonas sp. SM2304 TaxID=3073241 RepID=UPI00287616D9|nr:helix-turn-helix domain-containing protein [Pusillimonas sp. SM2304]MDS1139215.1 helix-turn-helix domain-containing protein [Pusillimonas sp. SM2304]
MKSAGRVFELIEIFEQLRRPATVAELVKASGFPQSSTSMLLDTLTRMGYLCWNPEERTYLPSLRLNMLGGWVHDIALPRSNLRLAMQELSRRTNLSVVLGQRVGRRVQYAYVVYAASDRAGDVPIGAVRPLTDTGLGYALMAAMPHNEVRRIATACLAERGRPPNAGEVDRVMKMVSTVAQVGFAYSSRMQSAGKASFSFNLARAEGANPEFGMLGLALAGTDQAIERNLLDIIRAINGIAQEFLQDVQIGIDPNTPINSI